MVIGKQTTYRNVKRSRERFHTVTLFDGYDVSNFGVCSLEYSRHSQKMLTPSLLTMKFGRRHLNFQKFHKYICQMQQVPELEIWLTYQVYPLPNSFQLCNVTKIPDMHQFEVSYSNMRHQGCLKCSHLPGCRLNSKLHQNSRKMFSSLFFASLSQYKEYLSYGRIPCKIIFVKSADCQRLSHFWIQNNKRKPCFEEVIYMNETSHFPCLVP